MSWDCDWFGLNCPTAADTAKQQQDSANAALTTQTQAQIELGKIQSATDIALAEQTTEQQAQRQKYFEYIIIAIVIIIVLYILFKYI